LKARQQPSCAHVNVDEWAPRQSCCPFGITSSTRETEIDRYALAKRAREWPSKISLKDGDVVEIEIDGIGVLRNEVRAV